MYDYGHLNTVNTTKSIHCIRYLVEKRKNPYTPGLPASSICPSVGGSTMMYNNVEVSESSSVKDR